MTEQLPYSRQEEQLNVLTHGMGVLFAVYVLWDLISQSNVISATVSAIVYGASLLVLFLASTLSRKHQERIRAIYKKCDHCAIYLLIAVPTRLIWLFRYQGHGQLRLWCLFGLWRLVVLHINYWSKTRIKKSHNRYLFINGLVCISTCLSTLFEP